MTRGDQPSSGDHSSTTSRLTAPSRASASYEGPSGRADEVDQVRVERVAPAGVGVHVAVLDAAGVVALRLQRPAS